MEGKLTYHGVEVPVWEIEHGDDLPAGLGWVRSTTENGPCYTLPCWRRPHPWRVMLEGRGDSLERIAEDVAAIRCEVERVREYAQWTYEATR